MTVVVPGFETLGDDPNLPVVRKTRTIHISDSLTIERGRHHTKIGGELRHYKSDGFNHLFARGQADVHGAFTGHPVGDLLLGFPTISLACDQRQPSGAPYVRGQRVCAGRLAHHAAITINAGVRYEIATRRPTTPTIGCGS